MAEHTMIGQNCGKYKAPDGNEYFVYVEPMGGVFSDEI